MFVRQEFRVGRQIPVNISKTGNTCTYRQLGYKHAGAQTTIWEREPTGEPEGQKPSPRFVTRKLMLTQSLHSLLLDRRPGNGD